MTQPAETRLAIGVNAIPATRADTGEIIVQTTLVVGPCAFVLEFPPDLAEQFGGQVAEKMAAAATAVRRAKMGVPSLLLPPPVNGHGQVTP